MALTETRPLFIRLTLPDGLEEALESLAREVLRTQPDNIYAFAADHFEALLKKRNLTKGAISSEEGSEKVSSDFASDVSEDEEAETDTIVDKEVPWKTALQKDTDDMSVKEIDGELSVTPSVKDEEIPATLAVQGEENQKNGEIDIDLTDPDVDQAATKIQANFKGMKARQEVKEMREKKKEDEQVNNEVIDIDLDDPDLEGAATKIQAGFKGMKARKEVKKIKEDRIEDGKEEKVREEEIIDIDLTDPDVEHAATKIQAGFKGMKARKEVKEIRDATEVPEIKDQLNIDLASSNIEDTVIDINLSDPDVEHAATKIQAGFKGMKTRKEMKENKKMRKMGNHIEIDSSDPNQEDVVVNIDLSDNKAEMELSNKATEDIIDIDLTDPEVEVAATKIQAGFKGMKTRKEVQGLKKMKEDDKSATQEIHKSQKEIEEEEEAATKIQAGYKGMKARKKMNIKRQGHLHQSTLQKSENSVIERQLSAVKPQEEAKKDDKEEEIDIDLTDPDVEIAATKIQAGFKGMKARKEVTEMKTRTAQEEHDDDDIDIDLTDPEVEQAATKIQAGFKGMKARKEVEELKTNKLKTEAEDDIIDIDLTDPDVEHAATKIQAGFKGMKARQEFRERQFPTEIEKVEDETIDIDLDDPDVEQAATKIQAGFKGMKARKEVEEIKMRKKGEENKQNVNQEIVDIDLNDPDVENAATKIQAGFKGMKARKEVDQMKLDKMEVNKKDNDIDIDLTDPDVEQAATKIQAGFKGMKARKDVEEMKALRTGDQTSVKKEEIDIDLNDPDVEEAATKIQAGFKGMKARRDVEEMKANKSAAQTLIKTEDIIDIDLNDPEVDKAATKIQAGFKGAKARKEVEEMKANKAKASEKDNKEEIDIDLTDPEVEQAATKIQAGFKGMKTRKEMEEMKKVKDEASKLDNKDDQEIDIDLTDPEVEGAATKIQAGFKGMKARKEVEEMKTKKAATMVSSNKNEEIDIDLKDPEVEEAATKIQAGFKGMKARKEVEEIKAKKASSDALASKKEDIIDIDLNDPEVEEAATKIQAGFKGMKARKEVEEIKASKSTTISSSNKNKNEDEIDIDLKDPEVEEAATKIQAGFKGMKARKEVEEMKANKSVSNIEKKEDIDIDLTDPDVEEAATKIQAGFKGLQARKEVAKMKESKQDKKDIVGEAEQTDLTVIGGPSTGADNKDAIRHIASVDLPDSLAKNYEDDIDIDLEDPEVEEAATKIQSGFKGMKARKEVEELKANKSMSNTENKEDIDIDLTDPDMEEAATKIQAGFKGLQARKEVAKMKESKQDKKDIVGEVEQTDLTVTGGPSTGADNKDAVRQITSVDFPDDGYNSPEIGTWRSSKVEMYDSPASSVHSTPEKNKSISIEAAATRVALVGTAGAVLATHLDEEIDNKAEATPTESVHESSMNDHRQISSLASHTVTQHPSIDSSSFQSSASGVALAMAGSTVTAPIFSFFGNQSQAPQNASQDGLDKKYIRDSEDLGFVEEKEGENSETCPQVVSGHSSIQNESDAATMIQAGFKGLQTRQALSGMKRKREEENVNGKKLATDRESTDSMAAATAIQAGFRGMEAKRGVSSLNRERDVILNDKKLDTLSDKEYYNLLMGKTKITDEGTIDYDQTRAATKIQAGYRGMKDRRMIKGQNNAATTIQAGYRGMVGRKMVAAKMAAKSLKNNNKRKQSKSELSIENETSIIQSTDIVATAASVGTVGTVLDAGANEDSFIEEAASVVQNGFVQIKENDINRNIKEDERSIEESGNDVQNEYVHSKESETNTNADENRRVLEEAATILQNGFAKIDDKLVGVLGASHDSDSLAKEEDMLNNEDEITPKNSLVDKNKIGDNPAIGLLNEFTADNKGSDELQRESNNDNNSHLSIYDKAATVVQNGFTQMKEVNTENLIKNEDKLKQIENIIELSDPKNSTDQLFSEWKVVDKTNSGEPLVLVPEVQDSDYPLDSSDEILDSFEKNDNVQARGKPVLVRESSRNAILVGAIPFEMHENYSNQGHTNADSSKAKGKASNQEDPTGLIKEEQEYYDPHTPIHLYTADNSPHCQKVAMYLAERSIKYTAQEINLHGMEQFDPWFVKINPKCQVPVLKFDNKQNVPDSMKIMHFLEERVPIDDHPMMIPCTTKSKLYQKYVYFATILDQVDLAKLTLGTAFHPQDSLNPQQPFSTNEFANMRSKADDRIDHLEDIAKSQEDDVHLLKDALERLKDNVEESKNDDKYMALLDDLGGVLDRIEEQLECVEKDAWLLGGQFSAADIQLSVLMLRVWQLGLNAKFWGAGKRPLVSKYWDNIQKRPSFQTVLMGGNDELLKLETERAYVVTEVGGGKDSEAIIYDSEEGRNVMKEMEDYVNSERAKLSSETSLEILSQPDKSETETDWEIVDPEILDYQSDKLENADMRKSNVNINNNDNINTNIEDTKDINMNQAIDTSNFVDERSLGDSNIPRNSIDNSNMAESSIDYEGEFEKTPREVYEGGENINGKMTPGASSVDYDEDTVVDDMMGNGSTEGLSMSEKPSESQKDDKKDKSEGSKKVRKRPKEDRTWFSLW